MQESSTGVATNTCAGEQANPPRHMRQVKPSFSLDDFMASLPTDVYIAFDAQSSVLYVGMTGSLAQRMRAHQAASEWWPLVARLEIERLDDRASAARREDELVYLLKPPHNAVNKPSAWLERDRTVLAMCKQGMSQVQIADELGISVEAVHRCTARLRKRGLLELRPPRAPRRCA